MHWFTTIQYSKIVIHIYIHERERERERCNEKIRVYQRLRNGIGERNVFELSKHEREWVPPKRCVDGLGLAGGISRCRHRSTVVYRKIGRRWRLESEAKTLTFRVRKGVWKKFRQRNVATKYEGKQIIKVKLIFESWREITILIKFCRSNN